MSQNFKFIAILLFGNERHFLDIYNNGLKRLNLIVINLYWWCNASVRGSILFFGVKGDSKMSQYF